MKIRTDFVTNSSSSSFTLVLSIFTTQETVEMSITGNPEGDSNFDELYASVSPKELGQSSDLKELYEKLKEGITRVTGDTYGPAIESRSRETRKFKSAFEDIESIDDIIRIEMRGYEDYRFDERRSKGAYDLDTGIYYATLEDSGYEHIAEGFGGEATFDTKGDLPFNERPDIKEKLREYDGKTKMGMIPLSLCVIESERLIESKSRKRRIEIPDGIKVIGTKAFSEHKGLEEVLIPGSVEVLDYRAFYNCTDLVTVTIEEGVKEIGREAFKNCKGLRHLTIPSSVKRIGYGMLSGLGKKALREIMANIIIPNDLVMEDGAQFEPEYLYSNKEGELIVDGCVVSSDSQNKEIVIPDGVTRIGPWAFSKCKNLEKIVLPTSIEEIEESAFRRCINLKTIDLPVGLTSIKPNTFKDSGLTSITIPNSVVDIEYGAFEGCKNLKQVVLPTQLRTIGVNAFNSCLKLSEITIPPSVKTIKDCAFLNTGLDSITLSSDVQISSSVFPTRWNSLKGVEMRIIDYATGETTVTSTRENWKSFLKQYETE